MGHNMKHKMENRELANKAQEKKKNWANTRCEEAVSTGAVSTGCIALVA